MWVPRAFFLLQFYCTRIFTDAGVTVGLRADSCTVCVRVLHLVLVLLLVCLLSFVGK